MGSLVIDILFIIVSVALIIVSARTKYLVWLGFSLDA